MAPPETRELMRLLEVIDNLAALIVHANSVEDFEMTTAIARDVQQVARKAKARLGGSLAMEEAT